MKIKSFILLSIFAMLERSLALGAAALVTLVQILCWRLIDSVSVFAPLKYLSVPALFSGETMIGNAVFVKLLGIPVNFIHTSLFLFLAVGTALAALAGHRYANSHKTISLLIRVSKARHSKTLTGIFRLELAKLLWHQKAALLLILVIALQPRFYDSFHARLNSDGLRYLAAIKTVEGEYTSEKQASLESQREELNSQLIQTADPLMQDELSARLNALEQVIALGNYLSTREENVSFVYETGFEAMFGIRPIGARYQNPLIAIALCLMLPTLFTLDRETGIHSLIQTTAGTKKLRRTKCPAITECPTAPELRYCGTNSCHLTILLLFDRLDKPQRKLHSQDLADAFHPGKRTNLIHQVKGGAVSEVESEQTCVMDPILPGTFHIGDERAVSFGKAVRQVPKDLQTTLCIVVVGEVMLHPRHGAQAFPKHRIKSAVDLTVVGKELPETSDLLPVECFYGFGELTV